MATVDPRSIANSSSLKGENKCTHTYQPLHLQELKKVWKYLNTLYFQKS